MADVDLGTRCEAQQRVLAEGVRHYTSWRDVDARIKEVERAIIVERAAAMIAGVQKDIATDRALRQLDGPE